MDDLISQQLWLPKRKQVIRSLPVEFVFLTLPYQKVQGNTFVRESDKAILSINSGYNAEAKEYYGIPYGVYPRLILYFICSEARRTKSKEIFLGKNIQDILERIAITEHGVRNNGKVFKSFKEQLLRLTNAVIKVTSKEEFKDIKDTKLKENLLHIVKSIEFWKKSDKVDYKLVLTDDFFNYLTNSSITVFDTKVLYSIKSSPISLDLYVLLNYKAYTAYKFNKDLFVSFNELYSYFGTKDTLKSFKYNIKKNIIDLLDAYPELNLKLQEDKKQSGILVKKDSTPTVQPDLFSSNYL